MRGSAVAKRVEEEAELRARLLVRDAERAEHLGLHLRIVEADRSSADLDAVEDEIVAVAEDLARIGVQEVHALVVGARERVVSGDPSLALLVVLEEGRVDDPEE